MFSGKIGHYWWLIVLFCTVPAPTLHAGSVAVSDVVAIQALVTDMNAAAINDLAGLDPSSHFTYSGNFSQSGWDGSFGGNYQGSPVSGTMDATIVGDPNYTIEGGLSYSVNDGKQHDGLINFPLVQQNGDTYTMNNGTFGGGIDKYTWSSMNLTKTQGVIFPEDYYDGSVTGTSPNGKQETWRIHISVSTVEDGFELIKSRFTRTKGGPPMSFYDRGTVTYKEQKSGAFNGQMNEDVAVAPEPSGLVLAWIAIVFAIGYWCIGQLRYRLRQAPISGTY